MNNTRTNTEDTTELEKKVILHKELYGYINPTQTGDSDYKTIQDVLGPFSDDLSNFAVTITDMLKKYNHSSQYFTDLFTELFEEEEDTINKLFSKEPKDEEVDYSIVTMLIQKYLGKKISGEFFCTSIFMDKKVYEEVSRLRELFIEIQPPSATSIECCRSLIEMSTLIDTMKEIFQNELEERKIRVVDEVLKDLAINDSDTGSEIPRVIDDLVDLAADVSLHMHRVGGEVEIRKIEA